MAPVVPKPVFLMLVYDPDPLNVPPA